MANQIKTKQARRNYICYTCKGDIAKGQHYGVQRVTIGKRGDEWTETINGYPHIVQNWMDFDVKYCQPCMAEVTKAKGVAQKGMSD